MRWEKAGVGTDFYCVAQLLVTFVQMQPKKFSGALESVKSVRNNIKKKYVDLNRFSFICLRTCVNTLYN